MVNLKKRDHEGGGWVPERPRKNWATAAPRAKKKNGKAGPTVLSSSLCRGERTCPQIQKDNQGGGIQTPGPKGRDKSVLPRGADAAIKEGGETKTKTNQSKFGEIAKRLREAQTRKQEHR